MPSAEDVLYQLALGLEYIHKMRLIHRDIKPQNVLIKVNATNEVSMKWAGFGSSKSANKRGTCSMSGVRGTYNFFAPEILKMLEEFEKTNSESGILPRRSVKSDVFAEALVFGYFLSGGLHLFGSIYNIESNIIKNNPVNLSSKKNILIQPNSTNTRNWQFYLSRNWTAICSWFNNTNVGTESWTSIVLVGCRSTIKTNQGNEK